MRAQASAAEVRAIGAVLLCSVDVDAALLRPSGLDPPTKRHTAVLRRARSRAKLHSAQDDAQVHSDHMPYCVRCSSPSCCCVDALKSIPN